MQSVRLEAKPHVQCTHTTGSGYPGDLSMVHVTALTQLIDALAETLLSPDAAKFVERFGGRERCLLRWLRVVQFDVASAKQRFLETLKWRIQVGANSILENPAAIAVAEKVKTYWPGAFCGTSMDALPIQLLRIGQLSPQKILSDITEEEMQTFYIYWMELSNATQVKYLRQREREGKDPSLCRGQIEIYDCSSLGLRQMHVQGLRLVARTLALGSTHYPENLYRGFIINIPTVFSVGWKVISPVLNENARRLITISSGTCEEELKALVGAARFDSIRRRLAADGPPEASFDDSDALALRTEGAPMAAADETRGPRHTHRAKLTALLTPRRR